jgi:hypothetical protein
MRPRNLTMMLYCLRSTILICLIGGCNQVSEIRHYSPPDGSDFRIEFDYPEEWEWIYESEVSVMRAYDPRYPPVDPVSTATFPYLGMLVLHVQNDPNAQIMQERIQSYIEATEAIGGELLVDKIIEIDRTPARWLERRMPERPEMSRDYEVYYLSIFCYVNGDLYTMHLSVPFEERDGEFARGFTRMVSSIEFIRESNARPFHMVGSFFIPHTLLTFLNDYPILIGGK